MLTKRTSTLDSGLHELSLASDASDLLMSDSFESSSSASRLRVDAAPQSRGTVARPRGLMPEQKVTVKLLTATGATDSIAAQLADVNGCEVISRGPQVVLAHVPREQLRAVAALPDIKRAEEARRLQFLLDEARGDATLADVAHDAHPELDGEGVVVGVVDSGTDWRHADFRNDDDSSRIEMFLHAVHDGQTGMDSFSEFDRVAINAALDGGGNVPDGDLNGHGTHCASIAAGNGRASPGARFRGVATRATVHAVRSDTLHDTHIIEGIRRIFERAGDRPAVVNLSLGGHIGPHDGTSALENVIARETGPGRIVVVAAGNEADDRIHFRGQLTAGRALDIEFTVRDEVQFIDIWIPRGDEADISIVDPGGVVTSLDGTVQQTAAGAFRADLREDQFNGDVNLRVNVAAIQLGRRWRIRLDADVVRQGDIHAWAQTLNSQLSRNIFMSEESPQFTIGMPATEERAIAVGSFVTRSSVVPGGAAVSGLSLGQLSPFSSHGPARHGAQRPDVAAPGQHIVAALAAGSELATSPGFADRRLLDDRYISIQGTSMATPFVTGVVALMLQQEHRLTPGDIQLRLRATSRRDVDTGQVWNSGFGYGKIDVEALLNYAGLA